MATPPPAAAFKVCTCGVAGVGKSSLIHRSLVELQGATELATPPPATIGMDFRTLTVSHERCGLVQLRLWDTAGQERAQNAQISSVYWRGAAAIVFVYDITSAASWEAMDTWLADAMRHCTAKPDPYVVVIGNKVDMARAVPQSAVRQRCEQLNYCYMETSAKTGHNVAEAFRQLADALVRRAALEGGGAAKPKPTVKLDGGESIDILPEQGPGCQC